MATVGVKGLTDNHLCIARQSCSETARLFIDLLLFLSCFYCDLIVVIARLCGVYIT